MGATICKPQHPVSDHPTYVRKASGIVESRSFKDKWLALVLECLKKCEGKHWKDSTVASCLKKARKFMDKRISRDLPLGDSHFHIFRRLSLRSPAVAQSKGHALHSYINTLLTAESFKAMLLALNSKKSIEHQDHKVSQFLEDELVTPTRVDDTKSLFERIDDRRQLFRLPRGQLVAKLDDCEKMAIIPHFICWNAIKSLPDKIVDCFTEGTSLYVNTGTRALKYSWKRGKFRPLSESEDWTSYSRGYLYQFDVSTRTLTICEEAQPDKKRVYRVRDPLCMLSNPEESFGEATGFTLRNNKMILICDHGKASLSLRNIMSEEDLSVQEAFALESDQVAAHIKDYDASEEYVNLISRHRSGVCYREQLVDANNIMRLDSRSFLVGQSIAFLKN